MQSTSLTRQPNRGLTKRLRRGAASALVVNAVGVGLAFLTQLVLARTLGVEAFGVYVFVLAWVNILTFCSTLGYETGLLRFVASYRAREQWSLVRAVIHHAELRVLLASAAVAAVGAVSILALRARLQPELADTFLVGFLIVPAWACLRVRSSIARAFGRIASALAPDRAVREGVVLMVALSMGAVSLSTMSSSVAMSAMLAGTLVGLALVTLTVHRAKPRQLRQAHDVDGDRDWSRTCWTLMAVAGLQIFWSRSSIIIVGLFVDQASSGVYAAATQIAQLVAFPLVAINVLFAPTISALHTREDHSDLQSAITTTSWWTALAGLATAVPLFVLAPQMMALFGPAFVGGAGVLQILLIGQVINAAAGSVVNLLTMTGNERSAAVAFGCVIALHLPLSAVLSATYGLVGAAAAAATALVTLQVAIGWLVWSRLRLVPSIFGAVP